MGGLPGVPGVSGSSLIGVAIACCGNVLISLALTIQKLAHRQISEAHGRSNSQDSLNSHHANNDSFTTHDSTLTIPVPHRSDNQAKDRPSAGLLYTIPQSPGDATPENSDSRVDLQDTSTGNGENQEDGVEEGLYLKSKLWWVGLAMISIGEGGNFLSYAFAPASVVAPLGTVALVANCIFAPIILKERFRPRELIGMGLAILGAVTVVYASNDTNPRLSPSELLKAITQLPFLIYTALNAVLLLVLILLSRSPAWGGRYAAVDVGVCAVFGGYTVLSTKAMASLLSTRFLKAFEYPITWGLLVVLAGTSIAQVKYLNKALMNFQSKEVIPTQFVFFSLAAIIGSAVLYQEFRDLPFTRFLNFTFGILTTFLGVHLLTSLHTPSTPPTSEPSSPSRSPFITPTSAQRSERSPLLIPATHLSPTPVQVHGLSPNVRGRAIRLLKRNSSGEIHTLGLNSQAGFLLMGSTPPSNASGRRDRSVNHAERGEVGSSLGR